MSVEIWDLYNENREIIGEHIRGEELPDDTYHLVVHVWIQNSAGKYLISQRSASRKSCPLMWETVGGSVLKGESSLYGAVREVKEEVGIDLSFCEGTRAFTKIRKTVGGIRFNDILDVWVFRYDGAADLSQATTDEVAQTTWLDREEIRRLYQDGKLVNTLAYFFDSIDFGAVQWVFFDIGSTLVDESACYEARCRETTENTGVPLKTFKDKVKALAAVSDSPYKEAVRQCGLKKTPWYSELEKPYPYTEAVLQTLSQKYRLGIIANQPAGCRERLAAWGIGQYFDLIIASAEEGVKKPDAAIFKSALERAHCQSKNAVMVGDRLDNDVVPAKRLGMKTVWVKQGFAALQPDTDVPDCTVESLKELTVIL